MALLLAAGLISISAAPIVAAEAESPVAAKDSKGKASFRHGKGKAPRSGTRTERAEAFSHKHGMGHHKFGKFGMGMHPGAKKPEVKKEESPKKPAPVEPKCEPIVLHALASLSLGNWAFGRAMI